MITEKLYDKDSHIKAFTAKVIDCRKNEKGFEVILDKTAFFPRAADSMRIRAKSVKPI